MIEEIDFNTGYPKIIKMLEKLISFLRIPEVF